MKSGQRKFLLASLVVAFALAVSPAIAKTVLWYHFNDGNVGDRASYFRNTKPCDRITNAAEDTGDLTGKPGGLSDATPPQFYANFFPTYTNDFPSSVTWYDPVTNIRGADQRCLWLMTRYEDATGASSVVLVDDHEKLHCENITVEFMAKLKPGLTLPNSPGFAYMLMMHNSINTNFCSWGIMAYKSGNVFVRMQTRDETGAKLDEDKTFSELKAISSVTDGNWHHIAFTYDGATVKLYIDYVLKASKAWVHPIDYNKLKEGILSIGAAYTEKKGRWNGFIDEVRISDEALPPEKFLRPGGMISAALAEKIEAVTDADTALYLPFDTVESVCTDPFFGGVGAPLIFNAVTNARAPKIKAVLPSSGMLPVESQSIVNSQIHAGIFSQATAANSGSWKFGSNSENRSIHIAVDDYSVNENSHFMTSNDFTLEFFINVHETPKAYFYILRELKAGGTTWSLYLSSKGALVWNFTPQAGSPIEISQDGFSYNEWHHVALVVSRTLKTVTVYLDGVMTGTRAYNFDLALPPGDVAETFKISGYNDASDQIQNISIDELRLTRRALTPLEFLAAGTHGTIEIEPTRAWIGFENNMKVDPCPDKIPEGTVTSDGMYSVIVPGVKIADGNGNILRASNTASMKFSGVASCRAFFDRNILLERDMQSQTVEFFMRSGGAPIEWAYFARMYSNLNGTDTGGQRIWSIGYHDNNGALYISVDNDKGNQTLYPDDNVSVADGRWHHIAVTFEHENGGNTLCNVYKDHKKLGQTLTFNGKMILGDDLSYSCLGIGQKFNGWIDEFRISKGVLSVDEMMHAVKRGTVVIFR